MFLEILQNSQENQNLFSNKVALEQVFSSEFCGMSKNTFSKEHLRTTASVIISENNFWKALLYYSNFVKKITECNQKCWTFPFRSSFVLRKIRLFCYKTTFAHSYSSLSMFFCQHYWNSCSLLLFHFCFKFYYPSANINVNHRYLVFFFVRVKPIQIVVTKTKKT